MGFLRYEFGGFIFGRANFGNFMVYLTIIPRGRVGYEMVNSQRGA